MNIVIGLPHLGTFKAPMVLSLVGLIGNTPDHALRVAMQTGPFIQENRTHLVHAARQSGADAIFFLDSDIACPDDTLTRLVAADKPIVGCRYNTRQTPSVNTVKMWKETPGDELPTTLFRCKAIGTGCLLIRMEVFDAIQWPWFGLKEDASGTIVTGEDVWFCERAHAAGYEVWCEPSLHVSHYGDYGY